MVPSFLFFDIEVFGEVPMSPANFLNPALPFAMFFPRHFRFQFKPELIKWENRFYELDEEEEKEFDEAGNDGEEDEADLEEFLHAQSTSTTLADLYGSGKAAAISLTIHGRKMALPEGSVTRSLPLCEEIHIPPPIQNNKAFLGSFARVKIDTLDEVCSQSCKKNWLCFWVWHEKHGNFFYFFEPLELAF